MQRSYGSKAYIELDWRACGPLELNRFKDFKAKYGQLFDECQIIYSCHVSWPSCPGEIFVRGAAKIKAGTSRNQVQACLRYLRPRGAHRYHRVARDEYLSEKANLCFWPHKELIIYEIAF